MTRAPSPPAALPFARRLQGAAFACALALCAPLPVLAQAAPGRVLLVEQGSDPFLERVGAEVGALGFELVRSEARGPLETAARTAGAAAAIRVLPSRKGVEVWMADSTSGRSLLRQVIVDERPGGPDQDVIALQTAELLRTSLLGEEAPRDAGANDPSSTATGTAVPATPRDDATAVDSADATEDASSAGTAVQLGFGALYSPGGASPSGTLGLSLQHFFGSSLGLGLDFALPVLSSSIDELEGSAAIDAYLAGATMLVRLAPGAQSWFATAGAGAGLLLVRYEGDTSEPLRASSGSRATAAVYAHGDIGLAPARWLRVGVRALGGAGFERVELTFAGNSAGSYGPALLAAFAFAGMHWP